MAESEKKPEAKDDSTKDSGTAPQDSGKQSTRTYSQSEFDSAMAQANKKATDLETKMKEVQDSLSALQKEKKDRELEEMSELEKANNAVKELTESLKAKDIEITGLKKAQVKNDVLADSKYIGLPAVYKKAIEGTTVEELTANADKILEQYNADLESRGVKPRKDVGIPPKDNKEAQPARKGIAGAINSRLKEHFGSS